jgi:hypothetical protein
LDALPEEEMVGACSVATSGKKRWKYPSEPEGAAAIIPLLKEEFPE